jgi:hypothetical protein
MRDFNEIIAALGIPDDVDPMAVVGDGTELRQGALKEGMVNAVDKVSMNYQLLHLRLETMLISMLETLYRQDDVFTFNPEDEMDSGIVITNTFSRNAVEGRDKRPVIVVGFESGQPSNLVLRDAAWRSPPNMLPMEKKQVFETMRFRIACIHTNRWIASFLGGQVRAFIASYMDVLRVAFNLQKVYPPALAGLGLLDTYDDLFACMIDLQVEVLPVWTQTKDPKQIKRIIVSVEATVARQLQGALTQDIEVVRVEP